MISSTIFVQEPDYVGFQRSTLPIQALGVVYDARDPYATPLGIIFLVLENHQPREIFVPRGTRHENGRIAYTHDLNVARYVLSRNGFHEAQLRTGSGEVEDGSKKLMREYLQAQNTKEMNAKYVVQVCG